jgi:hypothetical protein
MEQTATKPRSRRELGLLLTLIGMQALCAYALYNWFAIATFMTMLMLLGGRHAHDGAMLLGAWGYPLFPIALAIISIYAYRKGLVGVTIFGLVAQLLLTLPMLIVVHIIMAGAA